MSNFDLILTKLLCVGFIILSIGWGLSQFHDYRQCKASAEILNSDYRYDPFAGCWLKDDKATHWSKLVSDY